MARIRSVKPDLFLSEQVGELSMAARVMFIGLFTQADRAGRIEWAPKRLKVQLFPYDDEVDVAALVAELVAAGLARVYTTDGAWYLDLPGFQKHQRPHPKEPESSIPGCPADWRDHGEPWKKTASRDLPGCIPSSPVGREGKEIWEGKGAEAGSRPAVSVTVVPARGKRLDDPHGFRVDPTAAWQGAIHGRPFSVPEGWAARARNDYQLTEADIASFGRWLVARIEADGGAIDDKGKRLRFLDEHLHAWRAIREDDAQAARRLQATQAQREAEQHHRAAVLAEQGPTFAEIAAETPFGRRMLGLTEPGNA